jgi:F0F1-type ATP synthase assembly protein I
VDGGGPQLGDLLSMGLSFATCVVAGFGLGWLVDLPLGTFPAGALAGLAVGIAAACVYIYKMFKRFS